MIRIPGGRHLQAPAPDQGASERILQQSAAGKINRDMTAADTGSQQSIVMEPVTVAVIAIAVMVVLFPAAFIAMVVVLPAMAFAFSPPVFEALFPACVPPMVPARVMAVPVTAAAIMAMASVATTVVIVIPVVRRFHIAV
jgi:hypothetical protein